MNRENLDLTICKIASFGHILTVSATAEGQPLHPESLADLGRIIQEQAHLALEYCGDPTEDPITGPLN